MTLGVDIGGTFTDIVMNQDGQLRIHKLLSTPANPSIAMLEGLNTITDNQLANHPHIAHGSTVATNAILERKGARIALITTQGFRDVLYIGRQNRPDLYALAPTIPAPLIPRELCYEVPERLDHHGEVLIPLDTAHLNMILDDLEAQSLDAIVISFLYSFLNPAHEQQVRDHIIKRSKFQAWQVILSSDVLPQAREYERTSTVALEGYVRPIMVNYVADLIDKLPKQSTLRIMKSDGGVMRAERIYEQAVNTALSGPAAGVIGAHHICGLAGFDRIMTLDMGGTSTDVALIDGELPLSPNAQIDGLPLRVRLLDIETIGAGGGSIARVDAGGALRVGPESAGSDPGPIVYGNGGKQITVSDANVMLGRLDPDYFLGGKMQLDLPSAEKIFKKLAKSLKRDVQGAARGVIDIANVNIDRALRRVSVARGHDPRDFTLVAFGGAGPLHACEVASQLEISRVLIPRYPGVMCALGLLVADVMVERSQPILQIASRGLVAQLRANQSEFLAYGRSELQREGVPEDRMQFNISLDMRYQGQAHELNIPFAKGVIKRFHEMHQITFGHVMRERPVEIVNLRLQAIGTIDKPDIYSEVPVENISDESAILTTKNAPDGTVINIYDREKFHAGMQFEGQAFVTQLDSTVYIPNNWDASVDEYLNLILEAK